MAENPEVVNDNANKTLRDMMFPINLNLRPSAIVLPEITGNWELKHTLIQILPKYSAMPGEDPQRLLQVFKMACGTVRTASQALGEYIRLLTFPFSLLEGAREWLYDLSKGSIQTWQELQSKFLEKYFPVARIQNLRTRISNIKMRSGEILYEYWGRFKQMLAKCPQHQILDHDLIRYFMGGFRRQDRQWLHAACGGSILNKSAAEAFKLIADMAEESRDEEGTIARNPSTQDDKLDKQCNMFEKFMTNHGTSNQGAPNIRKPVKTCQLCMANSHATDECPQLFEDEEINAIGQQPGGNNGGQHQKPFEPYRQQYNNQGWRQHENFRYGNNNYLGPNQGQTSNQQQYSQQPQQARGSSLSELVHQMAQQQVKFQQEIEKFMMETRGGMQNVNAQLSHLAQAVACLESKQGELPAQVEVVGKKNQEEPEVSEEIGMGSADEEKLAQEREAKKKAVEKGKEKLRHVEPIIFFPGRMAKEQEKEELTELVKILKKVEVNMPLLVALRSMPRCAKFLKELCTRNVKYTDDAKFHVGESVSAVLQRDMPIKCRDPGMFYIPCVIGTMKVDKAMLDLGASINVMPLSMYQDLEIGPLKPTRVVIQLADRSNVYPEGILEDVLVKVEELIFPADFYILDMGKSKVRDPVMLLGRQFLKTSRTLIDCDTGKLTCQYEGDTVTFDIYNAMKHPADTEMVKSVDIIDRVVEEVLPRTTLREPLDVIIQNSITEEDVQEKQLHEAVKMLNACSE
ncbi:uncharacterized protein LOC131008188 [Salvia miltiorrhiza]|uniref:uncharacterized protein LOC131008188 n=1 Tax=Salvia miltiorrhiza TaxID=226208 RepID=UPI0025AD123A|nr:uncharacterized protein LOC131008188 [Salvia miltiorrhiza]